MSLDHEAIRRAYPSVVIIDDGVGALDASGNQVSLSNSNVAAARVALDAEAAAVKYKTDRTTNGSTKYADLGDQLDMLYKDIVAGTLTTSGTWATHVKAVKDANPKPS